MGFDAVTYAMLKSEIAKVLKDMGIPTILTDCSTNKTYKLYVDDGKLMMSEVSSE